MRFPCSKISPLSACSKPAISLRVVVFPHPEGPSIVKNSPLYIFKSKLFNIDLPSKLLQILFNSTSVSCC